MTSAGEQRYLTGGTQSSTSPNAGKRQPVRMATDEEMAIWNNSVDREKSRKGHAADTVVSEAATRGANLVLQLLSGNFVGAAMNVAGAAKTAAKAGIANKRSEKYFKDREKNGQIDEKTGLYKKQSEMSDKADLKAVNPEFESFNSNSKSNCMLCSVTYDMRKRGYDVTAQHDSEGFDRNKISDWYPGAKRVDVSMANEKGKESRRAMIKNTIKELSKQGNARGIICVNWTGSGGGHAMSYQVKNGKVEILCGQSNKRFENPASILKKTSGVSFFRLDGLEPDIKKIKKECVR